MGAGVLRYDSVLRVTSVLRGDGFLMIVVILVSFLFSITMLQTVDSSLVLWRSWRMASTLLDSCYTKRFLSLSHRIRGSWPPFPSPVLLLNSSC